MNSFLLEEKAHTFLKQYNLFGWTFKLDRSVRRFGVCKHYKREITMSRELVERNSEQECVDTLLHEIAHALVGLDHGHDYVWKSKAVEIGCSGNRLYDSSVVAGVPRKYEAYCSSCNKVCGHYHRRKNLFHRPCLVTGGKILYRETTVK